MSRKRRDEITNQTNMTNVFRRMKLICTNLFEWKGLPETINERYLEEILFENGNILWFEMKARGVFALQAVVAGPINLYNEPTGYQTVSVDPEFIQQRTMDTAVVMWNDYSRHPMRDIVMGFADRINRIERTIDINVHGQKTPFMIVGNDKTLLSLKNIYEDIDAYKAVIYIDKEMGADLENVIVHPTVAPYVSDKLTDLKHDTWNEFYTFMGLNNANTDKKERLNQTEVEANDPQIFVQKEIMLRTRQQACEKINEMFGLNISVDYKEEVMEVNTNGEVHNTASDSDSESE